MLKKFLFIFLLGIAGASAYLYRDFSENRELITPYPYSFLESYNQKYQKEHAEEIKSAESAKILIVGDRMGISLNAHISSLQDQFAGAFKTLPSVFNWSSENESLFRSIHKLKMLKKLPPIIVYFGASSELLEKRFEVTDKKNIFKNFATFDDEKLISLIITFPWLSKILYKKVNYFDIGEFTEYKNYLAGEQKLVEKEISFKIFQYELKEFYEYIKDRKSNLVLVTTPINLEIEPKEVCPHSTSDLIIGTQQELESEIKEGAYKSAFPKARELAKVTYSNARTYYLYGLSALGVGEIKTAREALMMASAFDCTSWRGNVVYNSIMKNLATKKSIQLVDFEQIMTSNLSKDGLFFDEILPQNIFYQSMIKELGDILKKILSVNE